LGPTAGCRRRIAFVHPTLGYAIAPPVPAKVQRRNLRERNRVKQVNSGFDMLRSHIPSAAKHKKMSKVDTLRHAVEYIQNLQRLLSGDPHEAARPPPLHILQLAPQPPVTSTPPASASSASSRRAFAFPSPLTPSSEYSSTTTADSGYHPASTYYSPASSVVDGIRTDIFADEDDEAEDELLEVIAKWQEED
jgi:achaete-scute complex protein